MRIRNKKILIAGGAGSIGSELVRQLAPHNKVFILDIDETGGFDLAEELQLKGYWVHERIGDICNKAVVEDVFSDFQPEIVINAAARKHVKTNEFHSREAVEINVLGHLNLIHASKKWPVKRFVYISTDKAVNANSIMGGTKLLGEIITRNHGYIAVRFGNVLGSRGSVIPFWQSQVDKGDPITVTDPRCERYFMSIEEACSLVIKAIEIGKPGQTLILDMGKPINVLTLAKKIAKESDSEIKMIGLRPGETLSENLMTSEEEARATKLDKFWIV